MAVFETASPRTATVELAIKAPTKAPAASTLRLIDWVEKTVILILFFGLLSRIGATLV